MLYEILTSDDVVESINDNLDYLLELIPELKCMIGFDQLHPHHHLDLWNHTLYALSLSENNFDIRLSLLLHDLGKPYTYKEENGVRHYYNHPLKSSEMSNDILKRLGYDEEYINKICKYIKYHDTYITTPLIINDREFVINLLKIQKCDALAHHPDKLEKRKEYIKKITDKIYN